MKLIELEITEIRGLRRLLLSLEAQNLVISGPNGSGKSGVVDAIDFLLTGNIQRLSGRGTGGLSLKKHGTHIGGDPESAAVRAVIALPDGSRHEVSRSMAAPTRIMCSPEAEAALRGTLSLAAGGQYVLSRREILRFITAEPADRATQIQNLLSLSDIEIARKALGRFRTQMNDEHAAQVREVGKAEGRVAAAAQVPRYDPEGILAVVNAQRILLGGAAFATLPASRLKVDLHEPASARRPETSAPLVAGDIETLEGRFDEKHTANRQGLVTRLIAAVESLRSDPARLRLAGLARLLETGMSLLDEGGSCPLCDAPWPPGELTTHLQDKHATCQQAVAERNIVTQLASTLLSEVIAVAASVSQIAKAAASLNLPEPSAVLTAWSARLLEAERYLEDPLGASADRAVPTDSLSLLARPESAVTALELVRHAVVAARPEVSPEQAAWDILTRIEEHLGTLANTTKGAGVAQRAAQRAEALVTAFEAARNAVLQGLYDRIKDRFVELYRLIHAADEADFSAVLCPEGAALKFEVDFLGTGTYPPHALHSEGHQDCMGLCLYLSLAEYLNAGVIDLIVLDDVVMSVDAGHRREVCRVLAEQFADKQFLITTHERAWAGQLRAEGVVTAHNSVTFYNWTLAVGPCVDGGDMWLSIQRHLDRSDVPQAAHALRHGLEAFFRHACGSLRGQVRYNASERWDLGDFLTASLQRLGKYLSGAMAAAKAWQRPDEAERIEELASLLAQAAKQVQVEQPAVNWNVHFNEWANFSKEDFLPVVEAMQELCSQFVCGSCNGMLEAQGVGAAVTTVRCPCGTMMLNLQKPEPAKRSAAVTTG